MRMKKLMIIAVAAIALAACSKTFDHSNAASEGNAIGFGTWTEVLTKSEHRVAGTNTFLSGDTFDVWGYKTVSATTTNVFAGDVVTAQSASQNEGETVSEWTYSPLRFWDATASSYTFFAVSPSGNVATSPAAQTGEYTGLFTSKSITFGGHDNDILVATKKVVDASNGTPKYSNDAVQIDFNHVASLIDIKVKKDAALPSAAKLKITTATLTAIANSGTFTVASYDETTKKPIIGSTAYGWVAANSTDTYTASATLPLEVTIKTTYDGTSHASTGSTDNSDNAASVPDDVQDLFTNFVLMPQVIANGSQALHIVYKIVTQEADANANPAVPEIATEYTADVPIKNFVTTDDKDNPDPKASSSWDPGKHYIYILTIGANAISFTASINDWGTSIIGYNYLIN